jgi:fructose-1,6-bisphosphatase I
VSTFAAVNEGGLGSERRADVAGAKFELVADRLVIPDKREVFGMGGLRKDWIPPVEAFVESLEKEGVKLRYGGTLVGDYNQVLHYGGIFGYPALRGKPQGKLRLLYEAAPMAFITAKAGGASSDGRGDVLRLKATKLSETTPLYLGTRSLVAELESLIIASNG